jgi:ABC-type branched-subunit amino acid transport system ATPase component/branched-subunit amino acid ABC-type transport system permease component
MQDLLPFIVIGLVSGSIYGLIGTGLVLTFKTTGIFNFGYGALASVGAFTFFALYQQHHLAWPLAAFLSIVVLGAVLGLPLSKFGEALAQASESMKMVGTIGIILLVQGLTAAVFRGTDTSIDQFLPHTTFELLGVNVGWEQAITIIVGVVLVAVLYVFLRATRTGAAMRGIVDDPGLLAAQGTDPAVIRRYVWIIATIFACLSGVLIAPGGLDPTALTLLVVPGFGAAAIGGFSSLPLTYAGGLLIGVLASLFTKWFPGTDFWAGLAPSLPFIVLVVALVALPARRLVRRQSKTVVISSWRAPTRVQVVLGVFLLGYLLLVPDLVGFNLLVYTGALSTVIVLLSLGLLVRTSGQVSLAHVAFMAIGAAAMAHFSYGWGLPWGVAVILATLVAVPVGIIVALPAVRLSGVYLALATLGFGILLERMFYLQDIMFGPFAEGQTATRPHLDFLSISDGRGYYYLILAIVVGAAAVSVLLHRARLGRLLRGMAGSQTALAALGTSTTVLKMIVFAVSAAMAALGGALYASTTTQTAGLNFPSFMSLVYIALLALLIGQEPWYAFLGVFGLVIVPTFIDSPNVSLWLNALFGFGAIMVAMTASSERRVRMTRRMQALLDRIGGRPPVQPALTTAEARRVDPRDAEDRSRAAERVGLDVANLTVRFGLTVAVDDVSLAAPPNRITGLIGPNGAGKTTIFNACNGLVKPTAGRIALDGKDISSLSPAGRARRGLGRTFQIMQLFDQLTVAENVALGAEAGLAGARPLRLVVSGRGENARIKATSEAVAELTGVSAYWHRPVGDLSTGQRRLVELARCLTGNFDTLLLDEPSSGLDNDETANFGQMLQTVVRERGVGILLVEHDMTLVMEVCEHIYVLDFGQLLFDGSAQQVQGSEAVRVAYLGADADEDALAQQAEHA